VLIVDGHLDLAWNALDWNRDLARSIAEIRLSERMMPEKARAANTVSFPELKKGQVMMSFATLLARVAHETNQYRGNHSQEICHAKAMGQLAYYELYERLGTLRILKDWPSVEAHVAEWQRAANENRDTTRAAAESLSPSGAEGDLETPPHGVVIAMEGADPITSPDELALWHERGLRLLGLAHYGASSYAHGTGAVGGLRGQARALLRAMEELGIILDLTHLADEAFWECLDVYQGPVHASHCNCRALVPGQRQLADEQIKAIIERDGVIGVALDMWMLQPGWVQGIAFNEKIKTLEAVVDHIDHICQLAGNAEHVAIGSDLDGGFGIEQTPLGLDTIADLQKIPGLLAARGYAADDVARIMHGNWLRMLRRAWSGR